MAKKLSLKEKFAIAAPNTRVYDTYRKRLDDVSLQTEASSKRLMDVAANAAVRIMKQQVEGATPVVISEGDSTVHHIQVARQTIENLPIISCRPK